MSAQPAYAQVPSRKDDLVFSRTGEGDMEPSWPGAQGRGACTEKPGCAEPAGWALPMFSPAYILCLQFLTL